MAEFFDSSPMGYSVPNSVHRAVSVLPMPDSDTLSAKKRFSESMIVVLLLDQFHDILFTWNIPAVVESLSRFS